ncbi:MAG: GNAT family protein [Anaerolineae bacterium]|nr:GNAT family protein [Anaerolineae bacterium]
MFALKVDDDISLLLHDMRDLEVFFKLIKNNHDHIKRFMDWVDNHQTLDNTRDYILDVRKQFGERKEVATTIDYQGEIVGSIGLLLHNKNLRHGEIGYWLDKNAVGKGIIARAARAMTDYGFTTLGLHKIVLRAMPHNERSLAVAKRLGYKYQGIDVHAALLYGEYYDFDTYYMLEDDWTATQEAPEFSHQVDEKIGLRLFEPRHADEVFALVDSHRAYLRQWLPWVDDSTSVDKTREFINSSLAQYAKNDGLQVGIWYEGEFCGACGYHYWDFKHKKSEIGYWLAESHIGKGIMTRTVKALLNYAFSVLDLQRVEIHCAVGNIKSCAIPERLGFTHEGVVRDGQHVNDVFYDNNIYVMLSDEWQK